MYVLPLVYTIDSLVWNWIKEEAFPCFWLWEEKRVISKRLNFLESSERDISKKYSSKADSWLITC